MGQVIAKELAEAEPVQEVLQDGRAAIRRELRTRLRPLARAVSPDVVVVAVHPRGSSPWVLPCRSPLGLRRTASKAVRGQADRRRVRRNDGGGDGRSRTKNLGIHL